MELTEHTKKCFSQPIDLLKKKKIGRLTDGFKEHIQYLK